MNKVNILLKNLILYFRKFENSAGIIAFLLMAFLPVLEIVLRAVFGVGISGSNEFVQHLTLWVGFIGAALASLEKQHLSLSSGIKIIPERYNHIIRIGTAIISTAVSAGLAWGSYEYVMFETASDAVVGGKIPVWIVELILPISFFLITFRFIFALDGWKNRAIASLGIPLAYLYGFIFSAFMANIIWLVVILLIVTTVLGSPIFILLGGLALVFFSADEISVAAIPVEAYRIVVSPSIPAIPLFTLAGYVLAESKTSERLVRLFRALFGWAPGGLILAITFVCAFFSTFTGASGVTILALGGLLYPVLKENKYPDKFSIGILTSTGSIGLLFPPSLAVIMYGVIAHIPIPDLFIAGILPGLILLAAVTGFGIWQGKNKNVVRNPFNIKEALEAVKEAKYEILLPIIILGAIFGGFASLIEASAIAAVYAIVIETSVHRDIHPIRDLPNIVLKCLVMLGGIFVIFGVAMGLTNYIVDAMIPMKAAQWVESNIESKIVFLLALNIFLLLVGTAMDIFSAIVVVVPLIIPISQVYNIDPLHLGMIFLVNLQLGYLTPPVGMNLFLASYRFNKPLIEIYRASFPFLIVMAVVTLLITYIPSLTIGVK
ncbi:MAG: TRAP transporter large permease subunit [Spirochaetia bacterium]|nr:TRAP transporter large permease subunit [Spirochaetia bacterium]